MTGLKVSARSGGVHIEAQNFSAVVAVKRFFAGAKKFCDQRRQRFAFFFELARHRFDAERVPNFKWTKLPGKSPAHGAIDVGGRIGNFRNAARGVKARPRKRSPKEIWRPCRHFVRPAQGRRARANVRACRQSFGPCRWTRIALFALARYSMVCGSSVRISDWPSFFTRL